MKQVLYLNEDNIILPCHYEAKNPEIFIKLLNSGFFTSFRMTDKEAMSLVSEESHKSLLTQDFYLRIKMSYSSRRCRTSGFLTFRKVL